jgi:hypothetical protein
MGMNSSIIMGAANKCAEPERMSVCFPGVASVKNSPEYHLLQWTTLIAGSVLDVPLSLLFHFPLAGLPLNNPSWASAWLAFS